MVAETEKPNLRAASCWSVEVVKGGAGVRLVGLVLMALMVKAASRQCCKKASASSAVAKRWLSSALRVVV